MTAYNTRQDELRAWYRADDKALGIIQLKLHDKLQYLVKNTSNLTWQAIKSSFDQQGLASIFVDFKAATNFQFNEKLEPAVQVAQLNNMVGRLHHRGFELEPKIQAMLILTGLPASWDGVQSTILANHSVENLRPEIIIPVLQEEWNR